MATSAAISAKEARISELRSALAASMAEKAAMQRQLEEAGLHVRGSMSGGFGAGGAGGHSGGVGGVLGLQQELVEARGELLAAQRRLLECQQDMAKAQV